MPARKTCEWSKDTLCKRGSLWYLFLERKEKTGENHKHIENQEQDSWELTGIIYAHKKIDLQFTLYSTILLGLKWSINTVNMASLDSCDLFHTCWKADYVAALQSHHAAFFSIARPKGQNLHASNGERKQDVVRHIWHIMSFCILFQSIINLYLVMIPWFLYRLGVGTWISLGFPTISKKGDVGRCEMQAECGSCSGWCSWCRGSWHEQDVARCCRKSSLKNCMKYGISTVWSLKVWLFAFLMVKLRLSYSFFCPKWFPGAFYIASVWGTWSECLWGRWSLIQLVNVRMRSVHTAWPFSAQKQRDVQRLSEWREFFAGCCTCWPSTLCFLASNVQIQRETRRFGW